MIEWIILGLAALAVIIFIYYYNRLVVLSNRIDNSLSQIDVQLKRRADLVPNLIASIKGYVKHEKGVIKEVTEARKALVSAKTFEKRVQAGTQLEAALKTVFALAENYPDLKANQNFLQLQNEISTIEDKIAYSRQFYNDAILSYNNTCTTLPGKFFAGIFNKKTKEFLHIPREERAVPKVEF